MEVETRQAIEALKGGGIVAFPTDTVYGLGADARNEEAIARVYRAKERPPTMALPLLLSHISQIASVAQGVPDIAWLLAERFLPGPLTLVLHRAPSVPSILSGGGDRIAVRVPRHPTPIALIEGLGHPITGTSANRSGGPSPLTAGDVHLQLGGHIDIIVDGGRCPGGVESTVLDLTAQTPTILRQGALPREEIERVCPVTTLEEDGHGHSHRLRP
ncbi:MAG: L-threonylcarbamoyladenylate synthase [Chloroflexota bacterium]|nr:L-threonylcarbamoyladenylate synthase [Chloroflexota bacterium]